MVHPATHSHLVMHPTQQVLSLTRPSSVFTVTATTSLQPGEGSFTSWEHNGTKKNDACFCNTRYSEKCTEHTRTETEDTRVGKQEVQAPLRPQDTSHYGHVSNLSFHLLRCGKFGLLTECRHTTLRNTSTYVSASSMYMGHDDSKLL